jgi:hypothetical protein
VRAGLKNDDTAAAGLSPITHKATKISDIPTRALGNVMPAEINAFFSPCSKEMFRKKLWDDMQQGELIWNEQYIAVFS